MQAWAGTSLTHPSGTLMEARRAHPLLSGRPLLVPLMPLSNLAPRDGPCISQLVAITQSWTLVWQ